MTGPTKNNMRGIYIMVFAVCLTCPCNAQDQALKSFLTQSEFFLRDGGIWKAPFKDYDPKEQWSPRYFGYEFQRGISQNSLKLRITGYFPRIGQWLSFWEGHYYWDGKKKKVIYSSMNNEGTIASGETESLTGTELTLVFTLTKADGTTELHKDVQRLEGDQILSESFVQEKGKWVSKNTNVWSRLEQPQGIITFMSTRDGNFEVYSMKATGDSLVNLTCNKSSDYTFSYAPGRRLVFCTNRDGNEDIYVMEADGKKVTNLTRHPSGDRNASVTRDGSKIVFNSYRDSNEPEIYIMDPDGSNVKRLTSNDAYEDAASWSPDGKQIVFSRELPSADGRSNGEIFVMDAGGGNERKLTDRPGFEGGPQFSPDGTRIAFHGKSDKDKLDIFIMNADGTNLVNLTSDDMEDYSPSWSPDGKWLAYTKGTSSNYDVWVMNIDTRIQYRLTTQPKRDESPIWH